MDHDFEANDLDSVRCTYPLGDDPWGKVCGHPRSEHRTTSAPPWLRSQVRRPVHARATEVYQATTRVPGMDVAVDQSGDVVLHVVQPGAYTITNLDGLIADLELARQHARRFELHPELYREQPPEPPSIAHEADGAEVVLTGTLAAVHGSVSRQGLRYAVCALTVADGTVEIVVPPVTPEAAHALIAPGRPVRVAGRVDRRDGCSVTVTAVAPVEG